MRGLHDVLGLMATQEAQWLTLFFLAAVTALVLGYDLLIIRADGAGRFDFAGRRPVAGTLAADGVCPAVLAGAAGRARLAAGGRSVGFRLALLFGRGRPRPELAAVGFHLLTDGSADGRLGMGG